MSADLPTAERTAAMEPSPAPNADSRYVEGEVIVEKYKLASQLASGGMGSLWVAKNLALDAQVALKLIRADVATSDIEERFLTEARTLARLRHPNIVRVFDFGRTRHDDPFMVMELLHGETLGNLIDRQARLPAIQTLQLLLPIIDAMATAHGKGIIHRDIKPDNVFLADDDGHMQPKVLDFGIAKLAAQPDIVDRKLTQAGTVVGSPEYLSPEQARGSDQIDHRTDIWSLCIVIYECMTGRIPFEGNNYNSLLRSIIEQEPLSTLELGAGDPELWQLLSVGLAKKPEARFQSMRELGQACAHWLYSHGVEEDACGHSLRATWLDSGLGRVSSARISFTTMPGLHRAVSTLPHGVASPSTPSPASIPSLSPHQSRSRWLLPVIAGATLAGLLLGVAVLLSAREARRADPAPEAAPREPAQVTTIVVTPAPAKGPESQPEPSAEPTRAPPRASPNPAPKPKKTAAAPASAPPAPAPSPAKPKGGYSEDLGF